MAMHNNEPLGQVEAQYYGEEDEEEMPATERELAEDAQWKLIQKNTFTRWANEHLKTVNKHLTDLDSDLSDGLRLLALVEVLSGKKFKKYNKRPNFRTQKLENVTLTLTFLEQEEGIRLVNIDSSDIVDHKLKLILGLIWTLILHYSISMPMWEGEDEGPMKSEATPKQRLLGWIQSKVPDRPVNNFTTDWNDGKMIGALVDAVAPGLCPDWEDADTKNAKKNAKEAMDAAEQWLNVPQLIQPDEMINPKVDELSMMTYLSQFPNAKLKPGAPLRPRTNPARIRAYGPGIEPTGNCIGAPARFTVETFSAGRGQIEVIILNPKGVAEKCTVTFNNDRNLTYTCIYTPTMEGHYKVIIKFAGHEIPKSPFNVGIEGAAGDATKCKAYGPGVEKTGVMMNKKTYFEVSTKGAGVGIVDVAVLDPHGHKDTVKPLVVQKTDELWYIEYTAVEIGLHSVNVFFAGKTVPNSPFGVGVSPAVDAKKCYATGRGIQPKGVRIGEDADFCVHTKGAGEGELVIKVLGPGGVEEKFRVRKIDEFTAECIYKPQKPGKYVVTITYSGQAISKSPFNVEIGPMKKSKIRAYGPGLEGGVVGFPACFTVDTNGEAGALGFSIEGPSQAKIDCSDNGDGSANVSYWPTAPGEYAVHILCNEEDIPNSPYMADIVPKVGDFNPTKVIAKGPGLEKTGVTVNKWAEFTVDTRNAGKAQIHVAALDADCNPVEVIIKDNKDGTYSCRYMPKKNIRHTVIVSYGGVTVPNSPFRVNVSEASDPRKVKVSGPAIEKPVKTFESTYLLVDCSEAGPGDVAIALTNERGLDVPVKTTDMKNNTFRIDFKPDTVGLYNASVFFSEQEIPMSPYKVKVLPSVDVSKVKIQGLDDSVFLESTTDFTVDARSVTPNGEGAVKAFVTVPNGQRMEAIVTNNNDGTYKCMYTPFEQGPHKVDVTYEGLQIPKSPFNVEAVPGCDSSRVRAYGPGLDGGKTDEPAVFTVETRGAGQGGLGLAIEGPSKAQMSCKDNRDGSCTVEYMPTKPGDYEISVKFADKDIPGSPFKVGITDEIRPEKVRCFGPGIEPEGVRKGQPAKFTVDTTGAGQAPLDVNVTDKAGKKQPAQIQPVSEDAFEVTYYPEVEGPCKVDVLYAGQPVPKSPFKTQVKPVFDASKVKVSGEGVKPTGVLASLPVSFTIDSREAGVADVDVNIKSPNGRPVRTNMQDNADGTYVVTYVPEEVGTYTAEVTYGGQKVPKSPFKVQTSPIGDASKVKILEGIRTTIAVGEECVININAAEAGIGNITCSISSSADTDVDISVIDNGDGTVSIVYTPQFPGAYSINIQFGGQPIPNGQFNQEAVENQENYVPERYIPRHNVSEDCLPEDCTPESSDREMGVGQRGGRIRPKQRLPRAVERPQVTEEMPPPPMEETQPLAYGEGMIQPESVDGVKSGVPDEMSSVYQPVDFCIPIGPIFNFVSAVVTTPSGKKGYPKIEDNKDGTVTIRYQPTEVGLHLLEVTYNNEPIPGSPFKFHVDAINSGFVTAHGPGLTHGISGQPSYFTIITKDAGAGGLSLAVEGPSKAEITCTDNKDGTCSVQYMPTAAGEYNIIIKFADKHISGSPFCANVIGPVGDDRQRAQLSVGTSSEVSLKVTEADIGSLTATIRKPSGVEEPCQLKRLANGHLGISFTPREVGEHLVNVYRRGVHIPNSPFKIYVGETEIGNASHVKVYGKGLSEGMANEINEFVVNTKDAGYGGLSLSIEGPSKADIECHDNEDGSCRVTYKPTEPGNYVMNVKFADEHVPGSPFLVKIGGEPSGRLTERITRQKEAADVTHVGSQCELSLKIPGTNPFDMEAMVTSPSGVTEMCDILELEDGHYSIKFVPKEMGVHTVSVKHKGMHISGSPFQFTVGPITDGGAHKVRAIGPGLERGEVNTPSHFNIYTREAGAGGLSIAVEGPSKAEIDFQDRKDGSCGVAYTCTEPGDYMVSVKFNDQHIPDSPFKVHVAPSTGDVQKLTVESLQEQSLQVNKPAAFTVDFNGAQGKLDARIVSPSGTEDEAIIQEIDKDRYAVRFIPRENGLYYIYVRLNGNHIPGSPFRVLVGKQDADPGLVRVYGDGLSKGRTGEPCKFIVNTQNAGSGALAVTVDGPSKVQLHCCEVEEGYEFTYTPSAPGDYLITIKYAGNSHVPGSPFKARIVGPGQVHAGAWTEKSQVVVETVTKTSTTQKFSAMPSELPATDASKVTASGVGLRKAVVDKEAHFNVDGSGAGMNCLMVGIVGPVVPCEEIHIRHAGCLQYNVSYLVKEPGNYLMVVKWGDDHIPGSPYRFTVQ